LTNYSIVEVTPKGGETARACTPIEKSDKWRCGHCQQGKVNPRGNSRCKRCKAVVTRVVKG
jgi:hypothetical protein